MFTINHVLIWSFTTYCWKLMCFSLQRNAPLPVTPPSISSAEIQETFITKTSNINNNQMMINFDRRKNQTLQIQKKTDGESLELGSDAGVCHLFPRGSAQLSSPLYWVICFTTWWRSSRGQKSLFHRNGSGPVIGSIQDPLNQSSTWWTRLHSPNHAHSWCHQRVPNCLWWKYSKVQS